MGSRNTFVTSFIYSPEAIQVVETALKAIIEDDRKYHFHGSDARDAGYFAGILKTSGGRPFDELNGLFEIIDAGLQEVGYVGEFLNFDIAVICDDEYSILHRWDRYGEYYSMAMRDGKESE